MDLGWSKPDLPAMTLHVWSSPPSSDVPVTKELWSEWARRTLTSEMKPSPREAFCL
ncbi:hypothetical protein MHBO_002359 [Bonamia ostreae]|uniref:Uncharacterized protein n=1 Tax=Bonamia ostreae TaxID=126728 RepID=A0ABV2AM43_9EUKA